MEIAELSIEASATAAVAVAEPKSQQKIKY